MKQFLIIALSGFLFNCNNPSTNDQTEGKDTTTVKRMWQAPDSSSIPANEEGDLIHYGKELIAHTSVYLGPNGSVAHLSNGMNCQNCHLEAGTKTWGNNFSAVYSIYPRFAERMNSYQTTNRKIVDCFERSLNGKAPDTTGKEIRAIYAYIQWLGTGVTKGEKPKGVGIKELPFPDIATDTAKGRMVFETKCVRCHGSNGQGIKYPTGEYLYPPLWGENSYNNGATLYRVTKIAGFIQANMPFDSTYEKQKLTDEQAWNVAAFISSQPRPKKNVKQDYPNKSLKPVDYPFGPYTDGFSEAQHKYGPYAPIKKAKDEQKKAAI